MSRKWIKIKTYFVLLAWMVIFLHNVIPHNHDGEQPYHCHSLFHKAGDHEQFHKQETEFKDAGENSKTVCHFNPVFCHSQHFGESGFLINTSYFTANIFCKSEKLHLPGLNPYFNPPEDNSNHLRAPPLL